MPINNPFANLFGRSPFGPMQAHMAKVNDCVAELVPFMEAVIANDWDRAEMLQKRISDLENEADAIKHDVRSHLPKQLFLPVPRYDLLELLHMQDSVANTARDIAGIMLGRKMRIPESMATDITGYLKTSVTSVEQAHKAMNELDELLETGFLGREVSIVEKMLARIDELEHEADALEVEVRAKLLGLEKDLPPVDVIFLYKVIDHIGDLADRAQKSGSRLELLLAR